MIGPFGKCTTVPPAVDVDGGPDGVLPEPAFKFDTGAVGDDGGPDTETWFDVDDGDALMIGDVVDAPIPNDADAVDVDVDDVVGIVDRLAVFEFIVNGVCDVDAVSRLRRPLPGGSLLLLYDEKLL